MPGPYHTFRIREPKSRLISAAPFEDRVVQHAVCNVIEPPFARSFIADTYACMVGRGTHPACDRFTEYSHLPVGPVAAPRQRQHFWYAGAAAGRRRYGVVGPD